MAKIKLRRDSYANWNNIDPTLASGEPGYDTTSNRIKIGDGVTSWNNLQYLGRSEINSETNTINAGTSGIIWTSTSTADVMAKLMVVGVDSAGDSQSCEILITKKSDNTLVQTVYAVIHTNSSNMYSLTASWDSINNKILVNALNLGASQIVFKVKSITI